MSQPVRYPPLEHLIDLMQTDDSEDAPTHVINRAGRLLRTQRAPSGGFSLRRRVLATLQFDSAQQSLALGLRAGRAKSRELLYKAGDTDLEVRVEQVANGWQIDGQVLGACSGGEVEAQSPAGSSVTRLNEMCEFKLPPLDNGLYLLLLRLDSDVDIEVSGLELGA